MSVTTKEFVEALGQNIYRIEFNKKDGTLRKMRCTRCPAYIPGEHTPKESKPVEDTQTVVPVFDLDLMAWRSVIVSNVISMEIV